MPPKNRIPCPEPPAAPRRRLRLAGLGMALAVATAHLWLVDGWARRPAVAPEPAIVATSAPVLALAPPATPVAVTDTAPVAATATARPAAPPRVTVEPPAPAQPRRPAPVPPPVVRPAEPPRRAEAEPGPEAAPPALALAAVPATATPARPVALATARLAPPPSVHLRYRVRRGLLSGSGTLDWQNDATGYRMTLEARVPMVGAILRETSTGGLDASGVAPRRHTEWRLRRSERALSFVRDDGRPRILFSAREGEVPLTAGAQDRLSWIAQLATRLAAPPAGDWRDGSQLAMDVASVGGDVQRWTFTLLDRDADGLWHLRREPEEPTDTRAEVWVDPRLHLWPVRIRLAETHGEPLELELDGLDPPATAP